MQTFIDLTSQIPAIGASGAIAAVLGAYFVFYPKARVKTFILLIIIPWFVDIPAFIFIGIWFVLQLFSGLTALSTPNSLNAGGVAWWAHIGGFLFGLLLAYPFLIGKQVRQWPHDEYLPK
jgi:membrane associated rhomboid family serine protease